MIRHKQLYRHEPNKGIYGDCHRTALACILALPSPESAPHFIGEHEALKAEGKEFDWQAAQAEWLERLGYCTADIVFGDGGQDEEHTYLQGLLAFMGARNPEIYYLLGGLSPRNTNHTIVCQGGEMVWDPHPDGGFLVGPMDHGFYEVTFVLPILMRGV